tara:strand:- start:216 stop:488 length:273 start_codon:yes stop_codon:yes gene_type:complete
VLINYKKKRGNMPDKFDMDLDSRDIDPKIKPDEKICSICSEVITPDLSGWEGHNAEPINSGKCCNHCNARIVEPIRFQFVGFPIANSNKN